MVTGKEEGDLVTVCSVGIRHWHYPFCGNGGSGCSVAASRLDKSYQGRQEIAEVEYGAWWAQEAGGIQLFRFWLAGSGVINLRRIGYGYYA